EAARQQRDRDADPLAHPDSPCFEARSRAMLPIRAVPATTWQVFMLRQQGFAAGLRRWRRLRGLSQLDLAGRANISQRHLSFLELERASPSRDMVIRLAIALDVPLRQHNALLIAAGFAPVGGDANLGAPELGGSSA